MAQLPLNHKTDTSWCGWLSPTLTNHTADASEIRQSRVAIYSSEPGCFGTKSGRFSITNLQDVDVWTKQTSTQKSSLKRGVKYFISIFTEIVGQTTTQNTFRKMEHELSSKAEIDSETFWSVDPSMVVPQWHSKISQKLVIVSAYALNFRRNT